MRSGLSTVTRKCATSGHCSRPRVIIAPRPPRVPFDGLRMCSGSAGGHVLREAIRSAESAKVDYDLRPGGDIMTEAILLTSSDLMPLRRDLAAMDGALRAVEEAVVA